MNDMYVYIYMCIYVYIYIEFDTLCASKMCSIPKKKLIIHVCRSRLKPNIIQGDAPVWNRVDLVSKLRLLRLILEDMILEIPIMVFGIISSKLVIFEDLIERY